MSEIESWVKEGVSRFKPILEPFHIPITSFIHNLNDQDVMILSSPQCPRHFYRLEALRCSDHEKCVMAEACKACIEVENEL